MCFVKGGACRFVSHNPLHLSPFVTFLSLLSVSLPSLSLCPLVISLPLLDSLSLSLAFRDFLLLSRRLYIFPCLSE